MAGNQENRPAKVIDIDFINNYHFSHIKGGFHV